MTNHPAAPTVFRSAQMVWIHLLLALWVVSMVFSMEFVLSQAMILLTATVLFRLRKRQGKWQLALRDLHAIWRTYIRPYPIWLAPTIVFLWVLLSGLWSSDSIYWLERVRIKSAFFVLPFTFAALPSWRKVDLLMLCYVLLWTAAIAAFWVLLHYWNDYEGIMHSLSRGQHMPTPSNHIRFSLTIALAILGGTLLWQQGFFLWLPIERWLIRILVVFLWLFVHLLAVRSGIAALYIGALAAGLGWAWQRRQVWLAIVMILIVAAGPVIAYYTLPTFKQKVHYVRWDWQQYRSGKGVHYSDSERFASLRVGWALWQQHFFWGTGAGDLKIAVEAQYQAMFAGKGFKAKLPHNQWLTVAASTGLWGLLLFAFAMWAPLCYKGWWRYPPWLAFHAIIFSSLMVENTFEGNYGISLYLLGLLSGMRYFLGKAAPSHSTR